MDNVLEENTQCLQNNKQDFLVSATVYKARHLQEFNCDTFVMVCCNGKYKRTRIAYRTDNPYFNEYFSFSLNCSERKLRRKGILFSLYQPSVCTSMHSCIGEFHVDLNTVWEQKNHGFFKKWATFEPVGRALSTDVHCGYLLIDLSIASSIGIPTPIVLDYEEDYDIIERNRLLPTPAVNEDIQRVRYCCSIVRGEFVHSAEYAVRVTYGGSKIRTNTSSLGRSYRWNEKLSFVGTFPTPNQIVGIDLLTTNCCYNNVKSTKDIHFASLSKRTNDVYNLPTFGPAWIHFYSGPQDSQYVGRLLISISTDILSVQSVPAHKTQNIRIYDPPLESNYWEAQEFIIRFSILRLQLFCHLPVRQLLVYLTCGDIFSKAIFLKMDKLTSSQSSQLAELECTETMFTIKIQLPDYRHKYFIQEAFTELSERLGHLMDFLRSAVSNHEGKNDIFHERNQFIRLLTKQEQHFTMAYDKIAESNYKQHTKLDQLQKSHILQQLLLKKSELSALKARFNVSIKMDEVSQIMQELESTLNYVLKLSHDVQNQHPDVMLRMFRPGHTSLDAVARFNTVHYMHQPSPSGPQSARCVKRCTTLPRSIHCNHTCPDRCGCIYAKLDYVLGIGTEPELVGNRLTTKHMHCKVHVYQGRIFAGFLDADKCNAKLSVLFESYEMALSTLPSTLSPCWNETVEFQNVPFTMSSVANNELGQKCTIMFVLQCDAKDTARNAIGWLETAIKLLEVEELNNEDAASKFYRNNQNEDTQAHAPILQWIPIFLKGIRIAEILVSSNVVETSYAEESDERPEAQRLLVHGLPPEIAPRLSTYRIRVRFVGLRQIHNPSGSAIKKSRILITLGDASVISGISRVAYGNSANFPEAYENCSVRLPVNTNYWPLMTISHIDFSDEKHLKTIGNATVNASELFVENLPTSETSSANATIIDIEQEESVSFLPTDVLSSTYNWANVREVIQKQVQSFNVTGKTPKRLSCENLELTWWTKFYNSQLSQRYHKDTLKIYDKELENIEEFGGFKDWSGSYSLQRIKRQKKKVFVKQTYGAVKCQIQISSLVKPSTPQFTPNQPILPSVSNSVEIVVVVYVVQALNLSSRDIMSESDAYIVLSYGNRRVRDRAFYIPNQASPVFGRRFEMRGMLPRDQMLHLSVYDRDFASSDDLIGSTYIDIEDRFWSKHLPSFGLPSNFTTRGYNKWRHQLKPSELLLKLCEQHGIAKPRIKSNRIFIGGQEFEADLLDAHECPTEQLCLLALNNFQHVANGFPLTPEHVETRSLYHPKRGGIEQGKVQLWIELYEPNQPHPLPLDITPQPPKPYELRLIVWNTADVMLSERNIFGTEMSDIYVKCWLQEFTEAQYTDVHYRSLTGEGNFNWRMIFPFRYSPADGMLVLRRRKAFYEQFDTELKYPPVLTVQVWDNDSFSADDFLGTMDLNLAQLPFPANCADACKFSPSLSGTGTGSSTGGSVNLFTQRRVRGWFPAHGKRTSNIDVNDRDGGRVMLTGKIELELEILSQEDAAQNPVGVGRKPPQHLPEPLRPEVSFNWLRQPAKTFNKLLWPRVRKSFIWLGTVIVLCLLIYGLVVNVPTVFMVRSLEQRHSFASTSSEGK